VLPNRMAPEQLAQMSLKAIADAIRKASAAKLGSVVSGSGHDTRNGRRGGARR
jgi:hypothetical protein